MRRRDTARTDCATAKIVRIVVPFLISAASIVHANPAAPDAGAPAIDADKCTSCHAAIVKHDPLHPIISLNGCGDCHQQTDKPGKCGFAPGRGWKLGAADPALCLGCHDVTAKTDLHPVITQGGCTMCHDPHGTDHPRLLKSWPVEALCRDCHEDIGKKKKEVHSAVKQGRCLGCHSPHAGQEVPLLRVPRAQLCGTCHKAADLLQERVRHVPVVEGRCLDCHDPHASNLPKQLVADGKDLCLRCHDVGARGGLDRPGPAKRVDLKKKNVHPPLDVGDCQDCHVRGHSSPYRRLLQKPPPALCLDCHKPTSQPFVHGAVRLGDCPVCHEPHANDRPALLRTATIQALCFQCHTDDVTGRAFIHKPVAEGKCTACHDPHEARSPFNLKLGDGKRACYGCHAVKDDVKFKHAALERGGCTVCHDPHGTANRAQLLKPVNQLCQSCHTDKIDGVHVTNFVPGGHRIAGGPDPHEPDKDLSCVSCHNPHGSNSPRLLRYGDEPLDVCDWCHGDRTGKHPELKDIHRVKRRPPPPPPPPASPGKGH